MDEIWLQLEPMVRHLFKSQKFHAFFEDFCERGFPLISSRVVGPRDSFGTRGLLLSCGSLAPRRAQWAHALLRQLCEIAAVSQRAAALK